MACPGQWLPEGIPSEEGHHLPHVPSALVPTGNHMDNTGKINEICLCNKKNHWGHSSIQLLEINEIPVSPKV